LCLGNDHSNVFVLASSIYGGNAECHGGSNSLVSKLMYLTLGCPSIFMNSMIDRPQELQQNNKHNVQLHKMCQSKNLWSMASSWVTLALPQHRYMWWLGSNGLDLLLVDCLDMDIYNMAQKWDLMPTEFSTAPCSWIPFQTIQNHQLDVSRSIVMVGKQWFGSFVGWLPPGHIMAQDRAIAEFSTAHGIWSPKFMMLDNPTCFWHNGNGIILHDSNMKIRW
jgi:hypothetical protein